MVGHFLSLLLKEIDMIKKVLRPREFVYFLSFAISFSATAIENAVVYGQDDRQLVDQVMDQRYRDFSQKIAPAIAVMVDENVLRRGKLIDSEEGPLSHHEVIVPNVGRNKNLCPDVKFRDLPDFGSCTGFLVGEDLLMTAGHCVKGPTACRKKKWIFDYRAEVMSIREYQTAVKTESEESRNQEDEAKKERNPYYKLQFPKANVFSCKEIVRRVEDREKLIDFALIRLDKKANNRAPLTFRKSGKICDESMVAAVGHPWGMPLVLAPQGKIRSNDNSFFFKTETDTFQGNSGSPIFNLKTFEVEGILVRGDTDTVKVKRGQGDDALFCHEIKRCEEGTCDGEDAIRVTVIPELILSPEILTVLSLSESYGPDQVNEEVVPVTPTSSNEEMSWEDINFLLFGPDRS